MKNIVLKDINPKKVESLEVFLKEMNDFAGLVTSYGGPAITYSAVLTNPNSGLLGFQLEEEGFKAILEAKMVNELPKRVNFMVYEGTKCLFQAKYTLGDTLYYALQVILNCDSESIVKEELIKRFERDFSAEAHVDMEKSLDDLREVPKPIEKKKEKEEEHMFEENEALIRDFSNEPKKSAPVEKVPEPELEEVVEEVDEIELELDQLSEKILEGISHTKEIVTILNGISHDLTRGACGSFNDKELKEEQLENGAIVQMIDHEEEGYIVTYRKGMLDDNVEISFFLERDDQLIFSVYLSSEGHGKISAEGRNGEHIVQQVKGRLNA